jgi:hypothetical protein
MQNLTPEGEFKVYPKRFFDVFQYTLIQMMTAILVNTFTPIAAYLSKTYDKDPVVIKLAGLFFVLMHPFSHSPLLISSIPMDRGLEFRLDASFASSVSV